jgi:nitrile hydratase
MTDPHEEHGATDPVERRAAALEFGLEAHGLKTADFIDEHTRLVEEESGPKNGGRVVVRAWTDPAFPQRLLANGKDAVAELRLTICPPAAGTSWCWRTRRTSAASSA